MSSRQADFLRAEARVAKAAAMRSARALARDAGRFSDPRTWVRSHPWFAVAAAVGAGIALGSTIVSGKPHESAPPQGSPSHEDIKPPPPAGKKPKSMLSSLMDILFRELLEISTAALSTYITSMLAARGAQKSPQTGSGTGENRDGNPG